MRWDFLLILPALAALFGSLDAIQNTSPPTRVGAGRPSKAAPEEDPYELRLTALFEEGNAAHIYLSDGTVWEHIRANPLRLGWLIGDTIVISKSAKEGWRLDNETYKGSVTARFERLARELQPVIQSTPDLGGRILLDNGSEWQIAWWDRQGGMTHLWKPGDRVIISRLPVPSQTKTHLLINLDKEMRSVPALLIRKNE